VAEGIAPAAKGLGGSVSVEHINPKGMLKSSAFSQGIVVPRDARLLLIGGQNGVDSPGQIVAKDLAGQTEKAVDNLIKVFEAAGGRLDDLVRLGIFVKGDADIRPAFGAWMARWGQRPNPPTIAVLRLVGLGMSPDVLIEIEGTATLK
jgi:enamine deaminase RidA (YjgF/YER057c/UK114 family)